MKSSTNAAPAETPETVKATRPQLKTGFHSNVHAFRGIAILMIVGAHTVPSFNWTTWPHFGQFIDILFNESSIYFFFIAGFLFQHLSPRYETRRYLVQKLRTVILPYLIVSIPALVVFTTLVPRENMWPWFYDLSIWQQLGLFLVTGKHLAPLWFVPTISMFYLAAPVLIWLDRYWRKGYWLLVPLLALAIMTGRNGPLGPIDKARYLAVAYLAGMCYSRYYATLRPLAERAWPALLALGAFGIWLCWVDYTSPTPPTWQMVQKLALAPVVLVALDRAAPYIGSRLDRVAEASFGIFFVHAYFIAAIKVAYTYVLTGALGGGSSAITLQGSPSVYLAYALVVATASLITVAMAQRLLGRHSRMVVGA